MDTYMHNGGQWSTPLYACACLFTPPLTSGARLAMPAPLHTSTNNQTLSLCIVLLFVFYIYSGVFFCIVILSVFVLLKRFRCSSQLCQY